MSTGEAKHAEAVTQDLPDLSQEEVRRYSRHLILPDVGVTGQRKLKGSSVMAVGAGGLGSPALLYLAAAGVGRLGIIDDDVVDESNLQRQVIHGTSTVGAAKVESAKARIADINPFVNVEVHQGQLSSSNALDTLKGYDVVLDGSDNFPTKYLVNDACAILGIPNVYGAILGFEGQVSVFSYNGGPNYRDLLPVPPPPGEVPSCAEGGVLGILPGVIGCLQATEVVKLLLGRGEVLSGRLLVYNALSMTFKESPIASVTPPVTSLVDYQGFCGFSTGDASSDEEKEPEPFTRLDVTECVERLQEGWSPYVLDVRLPQEAAIASLPFVDQLCPHRQVASIVGDLPAESDILVHCKVGGRSAIACGLLAGAGVDSNRLYNMDGGIKAWAEQVDGSMVVY
ncbi:unnamed protein product [Chrysoparadoxa australica]